MYWNFNDILRGPDAPRFTATDRPLVVEIGFGNGEYLEHLAAARRDATVIGIEISQWCLTKGARRALSGGFKNIRLILGDARYLLKYAFEGECVSEAFMNFPCPWPKRRHAERRVTRGGFTGLLDSRLLPGGVFTLRTDVGWYADETREAFDASPSFAAGPVARIHPRERGTKYERKWLEMGRDIYEVSARKNERAAADAPLQGEERETAESAELTELSLESPVALDTEGFRDLALSLKGDTLEDRGYRVTFRDAFLGPDMSALVKIISVDEGFEQHYYLKLVLAGGKLRAKADSIGHPYRTPGVRASLRHVMRKTGAAF
jgi:tRNA (guanine-N7-)-methyltransferase